MNTLGYILYITVTYYITVHTGYSFYKNGRVFILKETNQNEILTDSINKLLLLGYYLLNLGYVAITLYGWETIFTFNQLVNTLSFKIGIILVMLACIHYFNMFIIHFVSQKNKSFTHHKNTQS